MRPPPAAHGAVASVLKSNQQVFLYRRLTNELEHPYTLKFRNGYYIYLITVFFNRTLIIISDDYKLVAF